MLLCEFAGPQCCRFLAEVLVFRELASGNYDRNVVCRIIAAR
jgi:hypothetical protein